MTYSLLRLLVTLALLGGAVASYGVWYHMVDSKSARAAELAALIETKTATQMRASALRAELAQLQSDEALVRQFFVSADTIVSFLEQLQKYGSSAGSSVKVQSVSATSVGGQPLLTILLTISGPFSGVMQTVGRIEFAPYDLSVTSLAINALAEPRTEGEALVVKTWNANMILSVGSIPAATSTSALPPASAKKVSPPTQATTTSP